MAKPKNTKTVSREETLPDLIGVNQLPTQTLPVHNTLTIHEDQATGRGQLQINRLGSFRPTVFGCIRTRLIKKGIYRPTNRWRDNQTQKATGFLQRPQNLARLLPMITRYNFARQ